MNNPYFNFLIFLSLIVLSACDNRPVNNTVTLSFNESISAIKREQTFTLKLPATHPKNLAIVDPDNRWFYMQGQDIKHPFLNSEAFINSSALTITPVKLKATTWIDGKEHYLPVFTKNGLYNIYLSDNLETEPDNALSFVKKVKLQN